MGPSGSGKSSLLYLLAGLKQPSKGAVYFRDRALNGITASESANMRRHEFGFVFQQPFLLNYLTARENVEVASTGNPKSARTSVDLLLAELGIEHLADRFPTHLSGGERQRLVVARALVNNPSVIFADEPTAALDSRNGHAVIEMLRSYSQKGLVIVVSHDASMLADVDELHRMEDGAIITESTLHAVS